jgi:hypothetical protein
MWLINDATAATPPLRSASVIRIGTMSFSGREKSILTAGSPL